MYQSTKLPITAWAEDDRPREKLLLKGRHVLSDAELLAIILGSGNRHETAVDLSKRMLAFYNGSLDSLARLSVSELQQFSGVGEAKAVSVIAALELGRRRKTVTADSDEDYIRASSDSYRMIRPVLEDHDHEQFWMLMINRSNKLIRKELISKGGMNATIVDPKVVYRNALMHGAAGIVLCHNHPSGNVRPSESDIRLTRRLREAAAILEIVLLDHIIIGTNTYFSFADDGIL